MSLAGPPGSSPVARRIASGANTRAARDPAASGVSAARAARPATGTAAAAGHSHECLEWCPICRTADVLRASAPPELRGQIQSLQHDALVTLRALLDAYIERVGENPARGGSAVEDIPIE